MTNPFESNEPGLNASAIAAYAITPSDDTDLTVDIRQITLNVGGTVSYISSIDSQTYTTGILPSGTYPMFARRILATGTNATGITGWA